MIRCDQAVMRCDIAVIRCDIAVFRCDLAVIRCDLCAIMSDLGVVRHGLIAPPHAQYIQYIELSQHTIDACLASQGNMVRISCTCNYCSHAH